MRHSMKIAALLVSFLFWTSVHAASPQEIGIVLLHGKQGSGDEMMQAVGNAIRSAGYLVSAPETAWSRGRIYDKSVEGAMLEIDQEVSQLRAKGAKKIVVAGQSLDRKSA